MSETRITDIRVSSNINPGVLSLPFMFIQGQFGYSVDSILRPLRAMSAVHLGVYPDTFPNTIKEYYWIQEGTAGDGSNPWMALGRLSNDLYFFYTAQCKNTQKTFLDDGHMNLWVSMRFSDIINYAMDKVTYQTYFDETSLISKNEQIR